MRTQLLRRLVALEQRLQIETEPGKAFLPDWLVAEFLAQGFSFVQIQASPRNYCANSVKQDTACRAARNGRLLPRHTSPWLRRRSRSRPMLPPAARACPKSNVAHGAATRGKP